jgi:hypothetical protein
MKFRDPWIDPRIALVRPEGARGYLLRHGWRLLGPATNPLLELFEGPGEGEEAPTVLVPLQVDDGPLLQRMIDLVGDLARWEDRWAVDVLTDILRHQPTEPAPANGPEVPIKTEPATR